MQRKAGTTSSGDEGTMKVSEGAAALAMRRSARRVTRKRLLPATAATTTASVSAGGGAGGFSTFSSSSSSFPFASRMTPSSATKLFFLAMSLFLLADCLYLYNLSSEVVMVGIMERRHRYRHLPAQNGHGEDKVSRTSSDSDSDGYSNSNSNSNTAAFSKNQTWNNPTDKQQKLRITTSTRAKITGQVHHDAAHNHDSLRLQNDRDNENAVLNDPDLYDKGPILQILNQAGVKVEELDEETRKALPTWTQIQQLFGDHPRILGLERCEEFRNSTDPTIRFFGIAGTFNTGTNLLSELMIQNCQITERMQVYGHESKGMRWQVPWGKHYPASRRGTHVTETDAIVPVSNSLPLVTIRDPYQWMQSMCRHAYAAEWYRVKEHCPNIIPTEDDKELFSELRNESMVPITIYYANNFEVHHASFPHWYNEWYHLYLNATYPRIIVRFEDLLFYGQQVTETLCTCGGGVPREDRKFPHFVHISDSAKLGTAAHGKHKTDLVGAMIKYGNDKHRLDSMTGDDIRAAIQYLDPNLMNLFGYSHPSIEPSSRRADA